MTHDAVALARDRQLIRSRGRRIREGARLTRPEVAQEIGVDSSSIYRWEHGQRQPRHADARRYADLLRKLAKVVAPDA